MSADAAEPTPRDAYDLAVIGGGNMGAALLGGILAAGTAAVDQVVVVEPVAERRTELVAMFPGIAVAAAVPGCRNAIVAVKPNDVAAVAAAAVAAGARRLLSIAAGVTITTIETATATITSDSVVVLRAMPNTPALVGQGVTGVAPGSHATAEDVGWARSLLEGVGLVVTVSESQLDAVTGLTGSGPAYVFLIAEALADAGVAVGLTRAASEAMVAQLLVGSAHLLRERGDAAGLRAMVTSPAGTTAAGVQMLEQRAVRAALVDAVRAATDRSVELGRSPS